MATIIQKVVFKNTKKESLYDLYMNPALHSLITDGPVEVSESIGSNFRAFGEYITGKILQIEKNQLIVQSWHGSDWDDKESDSAFILSLEQRGNDAVLNVVHANVPEKQAADLARGWHDYYWKPWKKHLAGKSIKRTQV
jgi:activator of HSP90 ATPase